MLSQTAEISQEQSFVIDFSATRFDLINLIMQAELRSLFSVSLPSGPNEMPENPRDCWIVMQADIGYEGGEGTDNFTFYVTTPAFLQRIVDTEAYQLGRGLVVVKQFNWTVVEELTRRLCADARGESWLVIAQMLSRNFLWEFEDYQP
jgi:hypothetical protein